MWKKNVKHYFLSAAFQSSSYGCKCAFCPWLTLVLCLCAYSFLVASLCLPLVSGPVAGRGGNPPPPPAPWKLVDSRGEGGLSERPPILKIFFNLVSKNLSKHFQPQKALKTDPPKREPRLERPPQSIWGGIFGFFGDLLQKTPSLSVHIGAFLLIPLIPQEHFWSNSLVTPKVGMPVLKPYFQYYEERNLWREKQFFSRKKRRRQHC